MIPLYLNKEPKLYGSNFQMEFPSLEDIYIKDCPMLEKFSPESLHLPNLKCVSGFRKAELVAEFFSTKEVRI